MSVASTYADALYDSALGADAVPVVAGELDDFRQAVAGSPELAHALTDPEVDNRARKSVVEALTRDANPLTANFLQVLIDRGRIAELDQIAAAFESRVDAAEGRIDVHAVTAVPLPDDLRDLIARRIQEKTGQQVELTASVDPEIIGGLVLRVEGALVDGSLRGRLAELQEALRAAPIEAATAA